MLTVLLGGARSGKSTLAVDLARRSGRDVVYVATSPRIAGDADLEARIAAHRAERPDHWRTIETELDLAGAIAAAGDAFVIVDCLTVWLGNMLHHGYDEAAVLAATHAALDASTSRGGDAVVVSNEVGLGIVPDNELARRYRDLIGRVNRAWAAESDRALFMVAGRALQLLDPDDLS